MATPLQASVPDDLGSFLGVGSGFAAESGELARTLGDKLLHADLAKGRQGEFALPLAAGLDAAQALAHLVDPLLQGACHHVVGEA